MKSPIPPPIRYSEFEKREYPRDSVRLFRSDFLEMLTHVHPVVPALVWIPVVAFLSYRAFIVHQVSFAAYLLCFLLGAFLFTWVEYMLHRFVFHFPAKGPLMSRFVYVVHGLHHEDPQDPTRLVMPPLPAFIYSSILYLGFRALLGPMWVDAFFAGFLVGYLAYDYIHYYVHHFHPKNPVGKFLKRYHMLHHYSDYESRWGVSNPLWDYVFGTAESRAGSKGLVQEPTDVSRIRPA